MTTEPKPLSEATARFFELARIGSTKKQSGGTLYSIHLAEWLWAEAPAIAGLDLTAVEGFVRLIALANRNPFLVRDILEDAKTLNDQGKEIK